MKFITFDNAGKPALGVQYRDAVIEVARLGPQFPASMASLIEADRDILPAIAQACAAAPEHLRLTAATLTLLPPISNPGKIICVGLNYADHLSEAKVGEAPAFPGLFHKVPSSLAAHGAALLRPATSCQLDFEGELAIVIGRSCKRVPAERALEHVFGYTIVNDGSVRDYQLNKALAAGKNFDSSGACGPCIVTAEDLPPGARGLHLQTRLNGQVMQDGNTDQMIFDVASIIALVSDIHGLNPGDIISTGTCSGVGAARTPPIWLCCKL